MNRLIAALAIATLALTTFPALAAPATREGFQGGQRFSGGHPGAFEERHGFDGHREFDRDRHGRVFVGVSPWLYWANPLHLRVRAAAVLLVLLPERWDLLSVRLELL